MKRRSVNRRREVTRHFRDFQAFDGATPAPPLFLSSRDGGKVEARPEARAGLSCRLRVQLPANPLTSTMLVVAQDAPLGIRRLVIHIYNFAASINEIALREAYVVGPDAA
jgi:hypothetical protein